MKFSRLPIAALLAAFTLFAFTPSSLARSDKEVNSILKKIYAESQDGDAEDIYEVLSEEILKKLGTDVNSKEGKKLAKKVIKALKKDKSKLARGISNEDLDKVLKKTTKKVDQEAAKNKGNVTVPESSTQNG
jgi:hypothetical protein